jgi:hypothetical protein
MIEVHKTPIAAPDFQAPGPLPNFKGFYPSKGKLFCSTVQTGTGAAQNIAHGLGAVPAGVLVSVVDNSTAGADPFTVAEGAHTGTNVVVTVTTGAKYKVLAWL